MNNEMRMRKRQMLESLEYLDDDLISGVLKKIKPESECAAPVRTWRTPLGHWKQFVALAACLVLLSAAFPVINYVLPRVGINIDGRVGNAGAGTSELEMPTPTETEALNTEPEMTQVLETEPAETQAEVIDSGFDKALERYADMSVDEIYVDVLKGGWCVQNISGCLEQGVDLWFDFLGLTEKGSPAVVLYANYNENAYNPDNYANLTEDMPQKNIPGIYLYEISFDGKIFTKRSISFKPEAPDYGVKASEVETKIYTFLYASDDYHKPADNVQFILSNDKTVTDEMISKCLLGINTHLYIDLVANSSCGPTVSIKDYNIYLSKKQNN